MHIDPKQENDLLLTHPWFPKKTEENFEETYSLNPIYAWVFIYIFLDFPWKLN